MEAQLPEPTTVIKLLQDMVAHNTVNAHISGRADAEADLLAWLESLAKSWGMATQRLPLKNHSDAAAQLLIIVEATELDAPCLLFDSHVDTVAVDGMTIDPFAGDVCDGKLFGRGACDTKGTGAAMLWALKQYAALDDRPNRIALLFSVDEEMNMTGITSFIEDHTARLDLNPVGVIVGEPTMLTPVIAHNGLVRWTLTARGVAAHSAAPFLGKSAITLMIKAMTMIEQAYIRRLLSEHPLTGKGVCSITMIEGGSQVNIIPERCSIEIDRRLVPGESAEKETETLNKMLDHIRKSDSDLTLDLVAHREAPPLEETASEGILPHIQAILKNRSLPEAGVGAPFATHAGDLCAAGMPVVVWGPGSPYPAHTKDEYVETALIEQGTQAYLELMGRELK